MQQSSSISSTTLEFDLVMEALTIKVRPSTALAYRTPLEHWKVRFDTTLCFGSWDTSAISSSDTIYIVGILR